MPTPTSLFIEVPNQKGVTSPTDPNPIVAPDVSPPGTYNFNIYYLDYGTPDTYRRYAGAVTEIRIRSAGPPTDGTFTLSFLGYTTGPLSLTISNEDLLEAFTDLRSVGEGNATLTGNIQDGWTFEFVGNRAGIDQQQILCNVSACLPVSTSSIKKIQAGGGGLNCRQRVEINQDRVAFTSAFSEINAGGPNFGWTTISGIDTSIIPQSFWVNPAYDIVLEVGLIPAGKRTGADGISSQLAAKSGTDGVTADDGRGRSGTDGVIASSAGRSGNGWVQAPGFPSIYSKKPDSSGTLGTSFAQDDVGRVINITPETVTAGTKVSLLDSGLGGGGGRYGAFLDHNITGYSYSGTPVPLSWTTQAAPSTTFQSASAAFTPADVGHEITGANIPAGTTIVSFIDSTHVVLSKRPTATGTGLAWTITPLGTTNFSAASGAFTSADIGRSITGTNIQTNTTIATVVDSTHVTLSQPTIAAGTGQSWSMPATIVRTYQSATAAFTSADVGSTFTGDNIPNGTVINSVVDATHCILSNAPTAAGTNLNWNIINTNPALNGQPSVTRIQAGSSTQPEIQQIAFSELPDYGSFTITLGSTTTAAINAPLNIGDIQAALNSALPSLGPFTVTFFAKSIIRIQFGVTGAQSDLFTVGSNNLFYDNVVLSLLLVRGVGLRAPPQPPTASIIFDGDFSSAQPCGTLRMTNLSDGTGAMEIRQRFMQLRANWSKIALNSPGPLGGYLIGEDNMEDLGGGVVAWDRVYATLPANRTETHQMMRPFIAPARTYLNGLLTDIQLFSLSMSSPVTAYITYSLGNKGLPIQPGSPAGTVLHFQGGGLGITQLLTYNGFDSNYGTFYGRFVWSWSNRRWRGDIWEQVAYVG